MFVAASGGPSQAVEHQLAVPSPGDAGGRLHRERAQRGWAAGAAIRCCQVRRHRRLGPRWVGAAVCVVHNTEARYISSIL